MTHKPSPIVGLATPLLSAKTLVRQVWGVLLMVAFAFVLSSPTLTPAHAQDVLGGPKYKPYPSFAERKKIRAERALKRYIKEENERRKREGLPSLEEEEAERQAKIKRNEEKIAALKLARQRIEERQKAQIIEQETFEINRYKGNLATDNIYRLGKIYILSPWAPATRKGDQTATLYMTIVNPTDKEEILLDVTSPQITQQIEARISKDSGTMRGLEPVEQLIIPARSSIQFNVGGMHFSMLSMLKVLNAGDTFHLLFRFKNNSNGLVRAVVTDKDDHDPYPIDNNLIARIFDGIYDQKVPSKEELEKIVKKRKIAEAKAKNAQAEKALEQANQDEAPKEAEAKKAEAPKEGENKPDDKKQG